MISCKLFLRLLILTSKSVTIIYVLHDGFYSGNFAVSLLDDSTSPSHKDSIRAIRYGGTGKLFLSAGDDKVVKIWSTESWHCISTV